MIGAHEWVHESTAKASSQGPSNRRVAARQVTLRTRGRLTHNGDNTNSVAQGRAPIILMEFSTTKSSIMTHGFVSPSSLVVLCHSAFSNAPLPPLLRRPQKSFHPIPAIHMHKTPEANHDLDFGKIPNNPSLPNRAHIFHSSHSPPMFLLVIPNTHNPTS